MKKHNKLSPGETFFASYIATLGLFLIIIIIGLVFIVKEPNHDAQSNQKSTSIFKANQKTIDHLKQKQPIDKATQALLELEGQKRTDPFK